MQFTVLCTITTFIFAPLSHALTSKDVLTTVQGFTVFVHATANIASSIDSSNYSKITPQLLKNFNEIKSSIATSIRALEASELNFAASDQSKIFDAFNEFVHAHKMFTNTLKEKNGVMRDTKFYSQIGSVLEDLRAGATRLGEDVTRTIPTCTYDAGANLEELKQGFDNAAAKYAS